MKSGIFKTLFSVTGIIIIAKLLGFTKQAVAASLFGATLETDLINLSQGFLANLDYILVQILLTSFTAVYIRLQNNEEYDLHRIISDTIKAFALIAAIAAVLAFAVAPLIARILAPSYGAADLNRLTVYMRIYLPLLPLFAFSAVFTALLNAHKRFLPGELVSVNQSIIFLLIVVLFHRILKERSMILAFFVYTIWNLLFLGALSHRYWHFSKGGNPFRNPHVKELLQMCTPLLLSYSMVFINQQIDKSLASGLGGGTVTSLSYGSTLSNLVSTFIISFCSILFTYTATAISKGSHKDAAALAIRAVEILSFVFFPVSLLTIFCAQDVVFIAFGRGAFDAKAVESAAYALRGYGFLFLPLALREVFTRFQYGYQNTRSPTTASLISILCNIILSILLSRFWGIGGIAFATSTSVCVCGILNLFFSQKLNSHLTFRPILSWLPLLFLAGGCCLTVAWHINSVLVNASPYLRFPAEALGGLTVYFLLTLPIGLKLLQKGDQRPRKGRGPTTI